MTNLITLEEYKVASRITAATDDTRISNLIASVSQLVKTYCNNTIVDHYASNKTELFSINFAVSSVQLTESPVNSVVSVKERTSFTGDYVTLEEGLDFYLDTVTDSVFRFAGGNSYKNFPKGPGSVEVVYTAGWESCPEDLKLAVFDLIKYYFKEEHKPRQSMSGSTMQNPISSVAFPDHIKRVLDLYKNY
jgi:hypothetical protein